MLWKADYADLYLLPSIHFLPQAETAPLREVDDAFSVAARVAFEVDLDLQPDRRLTHNLQDGRLSKLVPNTTFMAARQDWTSLGQQQDALELVRPWCAAMTISRMHAERRKLRREWAMDAVLWSRAKKEGKQATLETHEEALIGFIEAPIYEQASFLEYCLGARGPMQNDLDEMVRAWRARDEEPFKRLLTHRLSTWPDAFSKLAVGRNKAWVSRLLPWIADGTPTLVVVGALHCVGAQGLPSLLAAEGVNLSRIV